MSKPPPTPLKRALFESRVFNKDLADAVGVSAGHLSRIANGLHCDTALQEAIATELSRLDPRGHEWTVDELFGQEAAAA